jgi:hypothetical protein
MIHPSWSIPYQHVLRVFHEKQIYLFHEHGKQIWLFRGKQNENERQNGNEIFCGIFHEIFHRSYLRNQ